MTFDTSKRYFDEPYSPDELDQLFSKYMETTKWKFLNKKIANSYMIQYSTISKLLKEKVDTAKILEVGPGGKLTASVLKGLGFNYLTLDAQEDVSPDICCDIKEFKGSDYENQFNLIAAFQILEHIPYENAIKALSEFKSASSEYIFISVPYHHRWLKLDMKAGHKSFIGKALKRMSTLKIFERPNTPNRKYREEFISRYPYAVHFWEIGRGGLSLKKFIADVESRVGVKLVDSFPNEIHPYHYYFVFKV